MVGNAAPAYHVDMSDIELYSLYIVCKTRVSRVQMSPELLLGTLSTESTRNFPFAHCRAMDLEWQDLSEDWISTEDIFRPGLSSSQHAGYS